MILHVCSLTSDLAQSCLLKSVILFSVKALTTQEANAAKKRFVVITDRSRVHHVSMLQTHFTPNFNNSFPDVRKEFMVDKQKSIWPI